MGGSVAVLTGVEVSTDSWRRAVRRFELWEAGSAPLPLHPRPLRLLDIAARAVALELERAPFAHDFSQLPPDLRRLVTRDVFRFDHYAASDATQQPPGADNPSSGEEDEEEEGQQALESDWEGWYDSREAHSGRLLAAVSQLVRHEGEPHPQPQSGRSARWLDSMHMGCLRTDPLLGGFGCGWGSSSDEEPERGGGGGGGYGGGAPRAAGDPLPRLGFHRMEQDFPDHRERFFLHAEPPHYVGYKYTDEHEADATALAALVPGVAERLAVVDAIRLFGGAVKPLGDAPRWLLANHNIIVAEQ